MDMIKKKKKKKKKKKRKKCSDMDPDPVGSAFIWVRGFRSAFGLHKHNKKAKF